MPFHWGPLNQFWNSRSTEDCKKEVDWAPCELMREISKAVLLILREESKVQSRRHEIGYMARVRVCISLCMQQDPLGGHLRKSQQRSPGDRAGRVSGRLGISLKTACISWSSKHSNVFTYSNDEK